jgi:hypothetical protein
MRLRGKRSSKAEVTIELANRSYPAILIPADILIPAEVESIKSPAKEKRTFAQLLQQSQKDIYNTPEKVVSERKCWNNNNEKVLTLFFLPLAAPTAKQLPKA